MCCGDVDFACVCHGSLCHGMARVLYTCVVRRLQCCNTGAYGIYVDYSSIGTGGMVLQYMYVYRYGIAYGPYATVHVCTRVPVYVYVLIVHVYYTCTIGMA